MSDCCRTAEDGSISCEIPQDGQAASCSCLPTDRAIGHPEANQMGRKIRTGMLLTLACLASPCCAPLLVPLVLAVLAGTPAAAWIGHHLGWVYGGLTLVCILSFALAVRQMSSSNRFTDTIRPLDIPILASGEKAHVE